MTLEIGMPLAEAKGEVGYGAEFFRWFAEEAVRASGRYTAAPEVTLERNEATDCADLGLFSEAILELDGAFADPTAT